MYLREAEALLHKLHPLHTSLNLQLATIHLQQHDSDPLHSEPFHSAFEYFHHSVNHPTGSLNERLEAACQWAHEAYQRRHDSVIKANIACLALLGRASVQMPTLETQHKALLTTSRGTSRKIASSAAASAITMGRLETAVEMLEQGRTVLWAKLRGYRHPLDRLRERHPELAQRFEDLGATGSALPFEVQERVHRALPEEWDEVVKRIREADGFQDFPRVTPFATLR